MVLPACVVPSSLLPVRHGCTVRNKGGADRVMWQPPGPRYRLQVRPSVCSVDEQFRVPVVWGQSGSELSWVAKLCVFLCNIYSFTYLKNCHSGKPQSVVLIIHPYVENSVWREAITHHVQFLVYQPKFAGFTGITLLTFNMCAYDKSA